VDLAATLGTSALSWRRFGVLLRNMPDGSALALDMHGESATWGVTDHLLATVIDLLNGANWQRGGGKGQKPAPFTRPKPKGDPSRIDPKVLADRLRKLKAKGDARRKRREGGET